MGQNQHVMHCMNALSNLVPIVKQIVKNVVSPVVLQVNKRRKTRVESVGSETCKGNIVLHYICTGLTTVAEI